MASASAEYEYQKEVEDLTECPICLKTLDDPRMLPCQHTFCLFCLQQYTRGKLPGDQHSCPVCREKFSIPPTGIKKFPVNFFMNKLMQINKAKKEEYLTTPQLVHTISHGKTVHGITCFDGEVFLVRDYTPEVEVYDIETFALHRRIPVKKLKRPWDLVSIGRYNMALFIADNTGADCKCGFIFKVDSYGRVSYWRVGRAPQSLYVTAESRIIVTFSMASRVEEYSSHGRLFRRVDLEQNNSFPLHTALLYSDQFLVSYRRQLFYRDDELVTEAESEDQVCVVDMSGHITQSFKTKKQSSPKHLNCPSHLVVDKKGHILVADQNNRRIILLSPTLKYVRDLIPKDHGFYRPWRICLDETRGLLFVAEREYASSDGHGRLFVFNVKTV